MLNFLKSGALALALMTGFAACKGGSDAVDPRLRSSSMSADVSAAAAVASTQSKLLGRATFLPFAGTPDDNKFDIKRRTDDWDIDIKARPGFDIAVQTVSFDPHASSGWHTHPGPVFIQVLSGTVTFYQIDAPTCTPIVRQKGEGYLDLGLHPHVAVNEGDTPAQTLVVYFAPPDPTVALKMMQAAPPECSTVSP